MTGRTTSADVPVGFNLIKAYPNPFNPTTTIKVQLREAGFASISVYNVNGQMVKELYKGKMGVTPSSFTFDANDLPSGVYVVKVSSSKYVSQKKLVLMR